MRRYAGTVVWLSLLMLCAGTGTALAQARFSTPGTAPQSIYRISPARDAAITGLAAAAALIPFAFSADLIHPHCPCNPSDVPSIDRGAIGNTSDTADRLSDLTVGAALLLPVVLDALALADSKPFIEDATVYAETLALTGALVAVTKHLVQRPLPRTYTGDAAYLNTAAGYRSFYSGHTAMVFASLTAAALTARRRYGEHGWPWAAVLLVGGSVAAEKVAAGKHFPSDVVTGAVVGIAAGLLVPKLHFRLP